METETEIVLQKTFTFFQDLLNLLIYYLIYVSFYILFLLIIVFWSILPVYLQLVVFKPHFLFEFYCKLCLDCQSSVLFQQLKKYIKL